MVVKESFIVMTEEGRLEDYQNWLPIDLKEADGWFTALEIPIEPN
jgi:hypothetical protein